MKVLLIGNGKVGTALSTIIRRYHDLTVYDLEAANNTDKGPYDVMHVCYSWHENFVYTTLNYIRKFKPNLCLIESTVKPNTTAKIEELAGYEFIKTLICHSPVRGLHINLLWGLEEYTKFVGPATKKAGLLAERYYQTLCMKTYVASGSTETEVSKLANLSYYANQIAFFQELERKTANICYQDVINFLDSTTKDSRGEVQRPIFKGDHIGGTCVMPGLKLLFNPSRLYDWISESNKETES